MSPSKHSSQEPHHRAPEPVRDLLELVEQAVAGGWYPARRLLLSRLAEAARPPLSVWVPEADVEETDGAFVVRFALPGVEKSDIRLAVSEDSVVVSGRRPGADEPADEVRRELPRGEFRRRVTLPAEAKPDSARAAYRDGVLRVSVARARAAAGRSVKIE